MEDGTEQNRAEHRTCPSTVNFITRKCYYYVAAVAVELNDKTRAERDNKQPAPDDKNKCR